MICNAGAICPSSAGSFGAIIAGIPVAKEIAVIVKQIWTANSYRNFNYLLLGYAMEVAAGKPWEDVLRAQVFDVADMPRTAYDDVWTIVPGRARGYDVKDGVIRNIKYKDHGAFAAGGLLSSTHA